MDSKSPLQIKLDSAIEDQMGTMNRKQRRQYTAMMVKHIRAQTREFAIKEARKRRKAM